MAELRRRSHGTRRALSLALTVAALALVTTVIAAIGGGDLADRSNYLILGSVAAIGVGALWVAYTLVDSLVDGLWRLGCDVAMVDPQKPQLPTHWTESPGNSEVEQLAQAMEQVLATQRQQQATPDNRLRTIMASLPEGMALITDTGLISLINAVALDLLGRERAGVGSSIFAAIDRASLLRALDQVSTAGRPVAAPIRLHDGAEIEARVTTFADDGGTLLTFPSGGLDRSAELHHDLRLHDRPPLDRGFDGDTLLGDIPALILDTETTGLDPAAHYIVSVGAVRVHGRRIFPQECLDRLVRPDRPIPAGATQVHGITDDMVADAPSFADVWPALAEIMQGTLLIGHNIGFDAAIMRAECSRAGIPWPEPAMLDTGHLFAALEPRVTDLNLEDIAGRLGLAPQGRHTALGDALVTAEIWSRLIGLMQYRGISTLDGARELSGRAHRLIQQQRAAGW